MRLNDADLSLMEYWIKHRGEIAGFRNWKEKEKTTKSYNSLMSTLAESAPELVKERPLSSLNFPSLFNILVAAKTHRGAGKPYSDSTVRSQTSLLRDIFRYAEVCRHASNPITKYTDTAINRALKKLLSGAPGASASLSKLFAANDVQVMEKLRKEHRNRRKSLSMAEMQSIVRLISDHLLEDGRYIGLAISLYTGLRPNECRALRWEDNKLIPGEWKYSYFEVHHVLEPNNKEKDHPKTSNGFRNVPIHMELAGLLVRWKRHVQKMSKLPLVERKGLPPVQENPSGYICCKGDQYGQPCSYSDFADFAQEKLFAQLNPGLEAVCKAEMKLAELEKSPAFERNENLTLYVLRRNFWTWMQYGTSCSKLDKLYVMGHEMTRNGKNLRPHYATPGSLLHIAKCMDQFLIQPYIYNRNTKRRNNNWQIPVIEEMSTGTHGYVDLCIPACDADKHTVIRLSVRNFEPGDGIAFRSLSPLDGSFEIRAMTNPVLDEPYMGYPEMLITETANLTAAERALNKQRTK